VQFSADRPDTNRLLDFLYEFYTNKQRPFQYLDDGMIGDGSKTEGNLYYVSYLLDKRYVIRYSMPIGIRTYAFISIGIGPHFISMYDLLPYDEAHRFSMDNTADAVKYNLNRLDEYLPRYSYCTRHECEQMFEKHHMVIEKQKKSMREWFMQIMRFLKR
jgi:hypothetical protein